MVQQSHSDRNATLFAQSTKVIPGGVNSPVRAYGSVGGVPPFIASAARQYVYDENGKKYLDLVGSWGPALLGHAVTEVVEAVSAVAQKGLSFGAPTQAELELAELVSQRVSAIEKIRFVSTGTEATMTAIRIARGITGRDILVKFAGCYHGHSDSLLVQAGSGAATHGVPDSAGVPASISANTIVLPYGDYSAVQELFASRGNEIAAIITEAAPANMGVVTPPADFNSNLVKIAHEYGALVIFDEVLTGFRVHSAGYWGLENQSELSKSAVQLSEDKGSVKTYEPDIFTFGKIIGGGLPLAAVGGKAHIMDALAPLGSVYQAGTLSGNPLATAAGITTLRLATQQVYDHINSLSQQLVTGLREIFFNYGIPHVINQSGNLFSVFFGSQPAINGVANYAQAQSQDLDSYKHFFHTMLNEGVYLPPSPFEAWFLSAAHTSRDIDYILSTAVKAARTI